MSEVGEESIAEGVIAEVLNGASAVGVGVSFLELGFGESRIFFEKERADGVLPCDVDQLLVALDRVGDGGRRQKEEYEKGDRLE